MSHKSCKVCGESASEKLAPLLHFMLGREDSFLDVLGDYGMLARPMRDMGFDFYWYDKYSQNLLACGFEANKEKTPFKALTAFEVLEHIHDPMSWIRETLESFGANTLIFTTEVYERGLYLPQPTGGITHAMPDSTFLFTRFEPSY